MKEYSLSAQTRQGTGKKANAELRKQDLIPGIIYGGTENVNITVKSGDVRDLIYTPDIFLINMELDGQKRTCILQELQFHPVTDKVIHIDFLEVFDDKPITIEVPIQLDGFAAGVRAGGKLVQELRKLKVQGLYKNVPERLHIDVTKMKLGAKKQVGQLEYENLEILNAKNAVVVAVRMTRAARSAAGAAGAMADDDEDEEEGEGEE